MCLSYENGLIPGNLHYKEPNPQNESLKAGILQVRAPASMLAVLLVTWHTVRAVPGPGVGDG